MFRIITPNPQKPFTIGRKEGNNLRFGDVFVSREHAVLEYASAWILRNLTTNSVTLLNQQKVERTAELRDGDIIVIGVHQIRVNLNGTELSLLLQDVEEDSRTVNIQGAPTEILLDEESPRNGKFTARTNENGLAEITFPHKVVDEAGKSQKTVLIKSGSSFKFGQNEVSFQEGNLVLKKTVPGFPLHVQNLDVFAGKKKLLSNINFDLPAGEILAIIGRSGQGKSTLLRLLEGVYAKGKESVVRIGDVDYRQKEIRERIAFLAQEPALRKDLTVEEIILNGGRTSMEKSDFKASARERLEKFCELFGLSDRRDHFVSTLSGGEMRRVALAQELMNSPGLIVLDEPLSGLDPYNSQILCNHLKQLSFLGYTVVLTTHSYEALRIAHKVLVLHQGREAFYGSPDDAYRYFETKDPEAILSSLNEEVTDRWEAAHGANVTDAAVSALNNSAATAGIDADNSSENSSRVLFATQRRPGSFFYRLCIILKQWLRDKGKLSALILQPLIIGFLFSQIFSKNSSLWTVAFAIILCANWFSLSLSIREFVSEKDILPGEFRKGLSIFKTFAAKLFLTSITAYVQTLIVYAFVSFRLLIHPSLPLLALILLCSVLPAIGIGLLVSSLAKNPGQANAFLPLLIIPQVALAGALVPLDQMQQVGKILSYVVWSRYNQSSLLNLFLERSDTLFNYVGSLSLSFIFYIVTIIILYRSKKAK